MLTSIKVKLYGESYKIHRLKIKEEYMNRFNEVALQLEVTLDIALLYVDLFECLNIKGITSIQDLIESTFLGLINNHKSQVELWVGRKRVAKLKLENLFQQQTLFPLYQTKISRINSNLKSGLYLEEKEIGLIGIYEIKVEKFEIDNLKFYLSEIAFTGISSHLLNEIRYNKQQLELIKSDALLRYQHCFMV